MSILENQSHLAGNVVRLLIIPPMMVLGAVAGTLFEARTSPNNSVTARTFASFSDFPPDRGHGLVGKVDCSAVTGLIENNLNDGGAIRIYADGYKPGAYAGGGIFSGAVGLPEEQGNFWFSIPVTDPLRDGIPHIISVYKSTQAGNKNEELVNSPIILTCSPGRRSIMDELGYRIDRLRHW